MPRPDSISSATSLGYSSAVRLDLKIDGRTIPLAQVGPDLIVLMSPERLRTGPAEVVMHVDDVIDSWPVDIGDMPDASTDVPVTLPARNGALR